jgi:hypothetical protein
VGFPKNTVFSDVSGGISIPKVFVMLFNVNTPLCKLSVESAIKTLSSAKRKVFIFVLVDKVTPFV